MIPIKLQLRNFMCYRENVPALFFPNIHTACISGDNGNGKSAIIDAMTWALWGKTRAKSDIDLIAQGQSETSVEFEFVVSGQNYRIIRKYAKPKIRTGPGFPILEFQVATDGIFNSISGNTISQTEQKIIDITHMDYETFINSAFLRQGHADEFTNQPPAKRKEVLTNILGLTQYDDLEIKAKELMKSWDEKVNKFKASLSGIDDELANKASYEIEYETFQKELSQVETQTKEQEDKVNTLQKQFDLIDAKKMQLAQLEMYIIEAQHTLDTWEAQINTLKLKIKEYESVIVKRSDIETGYSRFISTKTLNDALNLKLNSLVKLNEQKNQIEKIIDNNKNELLKQYAIFQHNVDELNCKIEKLPQLKSELQKVEQQQIELNDSDVALEVKRKDIQELRTKINNLEININKSKNDIDEINKKLTLLSCDKGAKCPLCEQNLGIEERQRIEAKYNQEKEAKGILIRSSQRDLTNECSVFNRLEKEFRQIEFQLKQDKAIYDGELRILHKSIGESLESMERVKQYQTNLFEIEQRLNNREYAINEHKILLNVTNNINNLDYDNAYHEEIRRNLTQLNIYEEPKRKLETAENNIISERDSLSRLETEVFELTNSLHNNISQQQILKSELTKLPQLYLDLEAAQAVLRKSKSELRDIQDLTSRIKEKLQHCIELEKSRGEKVKILNQAVEQVKIYQELAQSFGKKGIQALLIELVLPEIEIEADRLLAKMTDNRMHIKIETQRENKKGEVTETLDIKISDELGTRNYEMFSGGEAFRINFAIRIALSRLLARRAGAPLPTLIIDEGFGTQDNTGIEKLKEAINSIEGEFDKILVITHIEELKDAFTTRIDILKTAEGSTISVN
jgi:DNA repair protein SbcC/Rad50